MTLSFQSILTTSFSALTNCANEFDQEQSVRGVDAMSELQLHALIEDALISEDFGVSRETHYPSDGDAYTKATHRQRCDLVLFPDSSRTLLDPAEEMKQLAIAQDTLFAGSSNLGPDPETTCDPADAWWIEIKACAQHAYRDGIPSPNPGYAHELVTGLQTDLCKLSVDPQIWHAAVLVVLFCEEESIAHHDLNQAASVCIGQGLPVQSPLIETQSITDRGGNSCVAIGLFPVSV